MLDMGGRKKKLKNARGRWDMPIIVPRVCGWGCYGNLPFSVSRALQLLSPDILSGFIVVWSVGGGVGSAQNFSFISCSKND
jgi:hypothetical protein